MNPRKTIFAVLLLLFCLLLVRRFAQLEELLATLYRGRIEWVAVAVALQIGTLLNQPALYQALYELLGLPARWRDLTPIVWAGHFLNVATPAAGLGGTALLLDDGRRRGLDMGRVTLANTLYFLFNFLWFALLLIFSLVLLFLWHDLKPYEIATASALLFTVLLSLGGLLLIGFKPLLFSRLLQWLRERVNHASHRVLRREVLSTQATDEFATQFGQAANTLRTARGRLVRPWFHTMLVDGLEIAVLGACFAAFPGGGRAVTPALWIAGYSIGTLFLVVSITPQGLGVVEGVMTAIFVSLGVPLERAAVVVLAYRGLSFWMPLCVGFGALRWTPGLTTTVEDVRHQTEQAPNGMKCEK